MKKRSFFERLAGNLRFNEEDGDEMDDVVETPVSKKELTHRQPAATAAPSPISFRTAT